MNKIVKSAGIPLLTLFGGVVLGISFSSYAQDQKVYELRTYTAAPGKLESLHARFRDHTTRIFRNHGMEVVAYWSPIDPEKADNTLIYLLGHSSREAADESWRAFNEDPEWREVAANSRVNGPLLVLGGIQREFMVATDYSPLQ